MNAKHARLASLLAFLQRHQGATVDRARITANVPGYEGSAEASRKKLQRDLAELERACDLRVDYVSTAAEEGYRIRRRPLELRLDPQELAALAVLAGTLGPEDRSALHVEALGAAPGAGAAVVVAPVPEHPALPALLQAIDQRREVTFAYAKPGAEPEERRVLPWQLVCRADWYLIGYCRLREGKRTFKLGRIASGPVVGPVTDYEIPEVIEGVSEPWRFGDEATARLRAEPAEAGRIARRVHGRIADEAEGTVVEAGYGDESSFAGLLAGFGAAIEVLDPPSLREAVVDRLRATLAAQGGGS